MLYGAGNQMAVAADRRAVRFLLISGRPLKEPIARHGPIVMNSQAKLRLAFEEYQRGTCVNHGRP